MQKWYIGKKMSIAFYRIISVMQHFKDAVVSIAGDDMKKRFTDNFI